MSLALPENIQSLMEIHGEKETLKPERKDTPFPADQFKSSLKRLPSSVSVSSKKEQPVQPVPPPIVEPSPPVVQPPPVVPTIVNNPQDLHKAKSQIKTLLKENDILLDESQTQQEQIEDLQLQVSSLSRKLKTAHQELEETSCKALETQARLIDIESTKRDLERVLHAEKGDLLSKDTEIENLKELIRKLQYENQVKVDKEQELKGMIQDLSERYKEVVREGSFATQREKQLLLTIQQREEEIEQLSNTVESNRKQMIELKNQNEAIVAKHTTLERKVQASEQKEVEILQKHQEMVHKMEEALYERDVAQKREQSLLTQIETLTNQTMMLPTQYAQKHSQELQTLRSQHQLEKRNYCNQLQDLESKYATAIAQLDRAIREKRAVESELAKITAHLPAETSRLEQTIEELYSKLRQSERDKHEATQKLDSVYGKWTNEQHQFDVERRNNNERLDEAYRRIRSLEREINDSKVILVNQEKEIELVQQVTTLDHERKQLLEEMKLKVHEGESKLNAAVHKYENRIQELTEKLENVSQSHATVNRDLQKLLATQRIMSSKWKEESEEIRNHYEKMMGQLRLQLDQYTNRIGQLETHIKTLQAQKRELIDQVGREKQRSSEYHEKCHQIEQNNAALSRQVSQLIAKEVELVEQKKQISRKLDILLIEKEQSKKERNRVRPRLCTTIDQFPIDVPLKPNNQIQDLEKEIERIQAKSRSRARQQPIDLSDDSEN